MLDDWYEKSIFSVTIVNIILQIYILYLIQYRSPKSISEYKYFLNLLTIYDLMFSISFGVILDPRPVDPFMGAKINGLASNFDTYSTHAGGFTFYCGVLVVGAQAYSLMYRYIVLQDNKDVYRIFMTPWCKFIFSLIGHSIAIMFGWMFYKVLMPDKFLYDFLGRVSYNETTPNVQPGDKMVLIDIGDPWFLTFFGLLLATFVTSETGCVMLLVMILSKLRENIGILSRNTYKLHMQFTMLLLAQLLTPFVCIFIPVAGLIICFYAGINYDPGKNDIAVLGLAVYGLLNSLLTILFISPYRKYTYNVFVEPWLKPLVILLGKRTWLPNKGLRNIPTPAQSNTPAPSIIPVEGRHLPALRPLRTLNFNSNNNFN